MFDMNLGINGKKWVGGEDSDMFLRVKKSGMKVIFNPSIHVQHKIYKYRIKTKNLAKRAFNGGYSVSLMKKLVKYSLYSSTEHRYFEHLMLSFFPKILRNIFTKFSLVSMKQMYAVVLVLFFESIGFLYGYVGLSTVSNINNNS